MPRCYYHYSVVEGIIVTRHVGATTITDMNLASGKIRARQGGSTANWATPGTTAQDVGETMIQAGSATSSISGEMTVTFPVAFSRPPLVFGTQVTGGSSGFFRIVNNPTTSSFSFSMVSAADTRVAVNAGWIAIGNA